MWLGSLRVLAFGVQPLSPGLPPVARGRAGVINPFKGPPPADMLSRASKSYKNMIITV